MSAELEPIAEQEPVTEKQPIFVERRKNPDGAPLPPFQLERRKYPRTTVPPPFVAGATDPDLTRPSRTISPGKLLGLLVTIAIAVLACAGPVHNFLVKYNDNIVAILLGCFPAVLIALFMGGRKLVTFWRANLKVAKEIETSRRAQLAATRASARHTEPNLHVLPRRLAPQSQAAA